MTLTSTLPNLRRMIEETGGFTYDPRTGHTLTIGVDTGYAIGRPGTEHVLGDQLTDEAYGVAFAAAVRAIGHTDGYLGGWRSPDRGYVIEQSDVFHVPRPLAEAIGVARGQDAILNLATGEMITLA